jgi:hypothetical protein
MSVAEMTENLLRHNGILLLNLCLILPLLTAWSNGLDSSLVNGTVYSLRMHNVHSHGRTGLQLLPAWQEYFHNPEGKMLGLLNSSQNIGSLYVFVSLFPHPSLIVLLKDCELGLTDDLLVLNN